MQITENLAPAVFENSAFGTVRVIMRDGEPWFVAKDVCDCLDLGNSRQAVSYLDDDEKITVTNNDGNPRAGIPLRFSLVSESGLYSLVLRSRKPEAKAFKRWVTHEVLPSIRKTGQYSVQQKLPLTYLEALKALVASEEDRLATQEALALAERQRDEAIRTKAEIGSRKVAKALQTASAATRRANKYKTSACELAEVAEKQWDTIDNLSNKLGQGSQWKTVKSIVWLLEIFIATKGMWSAVGKALTKLGKELGFPAREIESSEYGKVKVHYVGVIDAFHKKLLKEPEYLCRYRTRDDR